MRRVCCRISAAVRKIPTADVVPPLCRRLVWISVLSRHCRTEIYLRLCFVHNQVNERLEKPIFDCAHLDDEYDCGCGDDGNTTATSSPTTASPEFEHVPSRTKDDLTGADLIMGGR
jgi:hypothetical protein